MSNSPAPKAAVLYAAEMRRLGLYRVDDADYWDERDLDARDRARQRLPRRRSGSDGQN